MPSKRKLVFFNRSYWPDSESTGQLLTELAESQTDDYYVEVVAGSPNHVQTAEQQTQPAGGFRRDVLIRRTFHTRFSKHSTLGRLCNLVSFSFCSFLRGLRLKRPHILVMQSDPFFLPLLGPWLRWWHGARLVCYLQDIYPDVAIAVGKIQESWLTRTIRHVLFAAYKRADAIIVVSSEMARKCEHYGIPADRLHVIENWANCEHIVPIRNNNEFRETHGLTDKFVVMYSGNMGLAHQLPPIIEAAEQLQTYERAVVVFIGEGARKKSLQQMARERNLSNVLFLGYQPRETLSVSLSAADLQIVSVLPEAVGCVMPSKLYGILAAGVPVLAVCPTDCELADIVQNSAIGMVCDATDEASLATALTDTIVQCMNDPAAIEKQGQRARRLCLQTYDFPRQRSRFERVLEQILPPVPARLADPGVVHPQ